jgi:thiamine biosynthesis lipoprotein ApbE
VLRVTDPLWLPRASAILTRELEAIDRACSRFRADSDLTRVNALAGGRPVPVAPLLIEALLLALRAAELTDGDVDPTVGAALLLAGYDRDWRLLERANHEPTDATPAPPAVRAQLRSGYVTVELDPLCATVRVPRGIALDLGATAKAWAADRGARAVHEAARCGVLVSLGGDLATAGAAPAGGWRIHVTDDHRSGHDAPGQTVSIVSGGLATSSTAVRRWRRGSATLHHVLDPRTGAPAQGPWRTVSVAAADCADANTAATAALVRGARAPEWLQRIGLPARLVAHDGAVLTVGDWPSLPAAPAPRPPGPSTDDLDDELCGPRLACPAPAPLDDALAGQPPPPRCAPPLGRRPNAHTLGAQPPRADDLP